MLGYGRPPSVIATTNLGKAYGARTLFEDVSLQLNAGSRYGLVGANGSGKTTFLKILAGDERGVRGQRRHRRSARASASSGRIASSTTTRSSSTSR